MVLHYLEGYSVEKAASILGLSLSAAKMRLSRGREMLKIAMEDQEKI
jgi:RNA polymerase sigma-70 factor (ECF subfamily)